MAYETEAALSGGAAAGFGAEAGAGLAATSLIFILFGLYFLSQLSGAK